MCQLGSRAHTKQNILAWNLEQLLPLTAEIECVEARPHDEWRQAPTMSGGKPPHLCCFLLCCFRIDPQFYEKVRFFALQSFALFYFREARLFHAAVTDHDSLSKHSSLIKIITSPRFLFLAVCAKVFTSYATPTIQEDPIVERI